MIHETDRESVPESANPIGIDGIEYIEFTTSRPQALGSLLERIGFRLVVALHRSREVELYRQGSMNLVVNSHPADLPRVAAAAEHPVISAVAIRVRDAAAAYRHALNLGAWEIPVHARTIELNIPVIHGLCYFGLVQYVGIGRTRDWAEFYGQMSRCPTPSASASCPGASCCKAPALGSTCN
jgi:4-hydroxyphenylpyruvate dioxygenase